MNALANVRGSFQALQEEWEAIPAQVIHGVVPKGLLTLLGGPYKEVAKTTSGTLVYRFERQTNRKKSSFEKHCVLDLECRILFQELQRAAFCILMSYCMENKLKKIPVDSC